MKAFLTALQLEPLPDGRNFKVLSPFLYCADLGSDGDIITVPTGFVTDLASVPQALWNIFPPFGKYTEAAVIHDYLYKTGGHIPGHLRVYTKGDADNIFKDASRLCEVGSVKSQLMYWAVKAFGKGSFNSK